MRKIILMIFSLIVSASCASPPKLNIRSDIPVRIEANGTTVCESTPCEIGANYWARGFGECADGRDTIVEAFSLEPNIGIRQSKTVSSECDKVTNVFFEMSSGGVVNTVSKPNLEKNISQKLEELNDLKKRGLITDTEYNEKRKQILDSY